MCNTKNKTTVKNIYKILLFLPFILLSAFLHCITNNQQLETYNTSLISISLTIATFSISFSFLQYQFSPYKALLKATSKRQLTYSFLTILLALAPLLSLFIGKEYVPTVSLYTIPILAYMLIFLLIISNEESNPKYLLGRMLKKSAISTFIKQYDKRAKEHISHLKKLEFSKVDETPMHDFGESKYQTISVKNNPFDFITEVIEISIKNTDTNIFEQILDSFLNLINTTVNHELTDKSDVKFKIHKLVNNSFEKVAVIISEQPNSKNQQNSFLEKVGIFLKEKALNNEQTKEVYLNMIDSLTNFAKKILEKDNSDGALFVVSLNRQLAQKGIYEPPKDEENRFFELHLPTFPAQIKIVGQKAVELKNSDFLYRCLEELGYLGCSAIKRNHYHVGIECLQSLVQLGREARANNVKCFWRHCMLETVDHAEERIWWMLSWVTHLDEKSQEQWVDTFQTAYSRLRGYKREVQIASKDGKKGFSFKDTEEPHKESFSKENYYRTVDYSDFKEIKEFKLY